MTAVDQLLSDRTVTVGPTGDYATLQAAFDAEVPKWWPAPGVRLILMIQSGFQPTSGIVAKYGNYRHVVIRSVDAVVTLHSTFPRNTDFIYADYADAPVLDCLIDADTRVSVGYRPDNASVGHIRPGCGVMNTWGSGAIGQSASLLAADDGIGTGAGVNGTTGAGITSSGSVVSARGYDASNSNYYGGQSSNAGSLDFAGGNADDAVRYAVRAVDSSNLNAEEATGRNAGVDAIRAFNVGNIAARGFIGTGAGSCGVSASGSSNVHVRDADLSGAGVAGVQSFTGSKVDAYNTNARKGVSDSSSDIEVGSGGVIIASNAIGGFSQLANKYFSTGAILTDDAAEASNYEAETDTLLAAMSTQPSSTRMELIDILIATLKVRGIWTKLDLLYVYAAHDSQAARLNWINPAQSVTATSSPTFTTDRGYTGNGSSAYLATGIAYTSLSQYSQDSAHIGAWQLTTGQSALGAVGVESSNNIRLIGRSTGDNRTATINNGSSFVKASTTDGSGHTLMNRSGSSSAEMYWNGTNISATGGSNSSTIPSGNIVFLKSNTTFASCQLAIAHVGSSLTATEASDMHSAFADYLTAIGAV